MDIWPIGVPMANVQGHVVVVCSTELGCTCHHSTVAKSVLVKPWSTKSVTLRSVLIVRKMTLGREKIKICRHFDLKINMIFYLSRREQCNNPESRCGMSISYQVYLCFYDFWSVVNSPFQKPVKLYKRQFQNHRKM